MNNQLGVYRASQGTVLPPPLPNIHPVTKFIATTIACTIAGAIIGYGQYWLARLMIRIGMVQIDPLTPIQPLPHVLSGVAGLLLVQTANTTYDISLYLLGKREDYENLSNPQTASSSDILRQKAWRVIARTEKCISDIDVIASRILGIRSSEEIATQNIEDADLYYLEFARRESKNEIDQIIKTIVPQQLGIAIVQKLGYTIVGLQSLGWLYGLFIFVGILNKIDSVYRKIQDEADKKEEERKAAGQEAAIGPFSTEEGAAKEGETQLIIEETL